MKRLSIGSLMLLWIIILMGQARPAETFRLVHSDRLFLNKTDTEQILELLGNVHFFYGRRSLRATGFDPGSAEDSQA
jgi:hypothetical protein